MNLALVSMHLVNESASASIVNRFWRIWKRKLILRFLFVGARGLNFMKNLMFSLETAYSMRMARIGGKSAKPQAYNSPQMCCEISALWCFETTLWFWLTFLMALQWDNSLWTSRWSFNSLQPNSSKSWQILSLRSHPFISCWAYLTWKPPEVNLVEETSNCKEPIL